MPRSIPRRDLLLGLSVLLAGLGCFRSPKTTNYRCTMNEYCPEGYICVPSLENPPGVCVKGAQDDAPDDLVGPDLPAGEAPVWGEVPYAFESGIDRSAPSDLSDVPSDVPQPSPETPPDLGPDLPRVVEPPPADGPSDRVSLKGQGESCTEGTECQANLVCADGFCCDKACTGCSACSKALNGKQDGQCLPVTQGQSAHSACAVSGQPCGTDGTCDGTGKCTLPAAGTACGSTCTEYTLTPKTCDGNGACNDGAPQACPGGLICENATKCMSSCLNFWDCVTGNCNANGTCGARKLGNGARCTLGSECDSGNCVGNICCASASCTATCQTCAGGTCSTAADSNGLPCGSSSGYVCNDGRCVACAAGGSCSTGSVCEVGTYSCTSGTRVCEKTGNASNSTICLAQTCSGSTQYNAVTCSNGTCPTASQTTTSCSNGCSGTSCAAKLGNGSACTSGSGTQCTSGNCVNGICCQSSSCNTPCQTCAAGTGVCTTVPGQNGQTCNGIAGNVCYNGQCNPCTAGGACSPTNVCKTGTYSCQTGIQTCVESGNRPNSHVCRTESCSNGTLTSAATCFGGVCPGATTTPCEPYGFCHDSASCATGWPLGHDCGYDQPCDSTFCRMEDAPPYPYARKCASSCGGLNDHCCDGGDCLPGYYCGDTTGNWRCERCGAYGQWCCPYPNPDPCNNGLTCQDDGNGKSKCL